MPIQNSIWTVGKSPTALRPSRLLSEQALEEMIVQDIRILSNEWMLIGRQEGTSFGGRIDLLAIAPDGALVLIELKRDKTPREIVAQAVDYASWVERLTPEKISQIFERFSKGGSLDTAFKRRFGNELDDEALNNSHQVVIVAAELDASTERIVTYLNERDVAINVVLFQVFEHKGQRLLSRIWLVDPSETQANVTATGSGRGEKEPWNGEYYVSFGGDSREWEEAQKHGFISAGGGAWYSQTLRALSPNDRIWVNIPKKGYVGVGRVAEAMVPVKEFRLQTPRGLKPATSVLKHGQEYRRFQDDLDKSEYFVRVEWLDTVPEARAFKETGLFGNQNTVCRPTDPAWRHTVERLKKRFLKWGK